MFWVSFKQGNLGSLELSKMEFRCGNACRPILWTFENRGDEKSYFANTYIVKMNSYNEKIFQQKFYIYFLGIRKSVYVAISCDIVRVRWNKMMRERKIATFLDSQISLFGYIASTARVAIEYEKCLSVTKLISFGTKGAKLVRNSAKFKQRVQNFHFKSIK